MSGGVILLGGGIDSTSLLVWLRKENPNLPLNAFHVYYGQKAFSAEEKANKYFCSKYGVPLKQMTMDLREIANSHILRGTSVGTVPEANKLEGRNIILISLAATWASTLGMESVYVGYHREPVRAPFPDATEATWRNMFLVLQTAYRPEIFLQAPFIGKSRRQVFKLGLSYDPEILTKTFTCYEGGETECGQCVHCKTKRQMLAEMENE